MSKKKKDQKRKMPKVNPALAGFDIRIDHLGEIKSTFEIEKINAFLDKEVEDKKLTDRVDSKPKAKSNPKKKKAEGDS